jgi:hypothetical protein
MESTSLEPINVLTEIRMLDLETLTLTDIKHNLFGLGTLLKRISVDQLPVIKSERRERLTGRLSLQNLGEGLVSDGLGNRKEGGDDGLSVDFFLKLQLTTLGGDGLTDSGDDIFRARDDALEDRFHKSGTRRQNSTVEDTTSGRLDLTHTTMDRIGMELTIHQVESHTTHVLLGKGTWGKGREV